MDPQHAADAIVDHLLDKQWFVAAIIFTFFIFFIFAAAWILNKVEKMLDTFQGRLDARDKEWFSRMDKRDDETKEMVHNYYNATGTTSLTLQAVGQSMNGVADRLENVEDSISKLVPK